MNFLTKTATLSFLLLLQTTHAIIFTIHNNCPYTVWPAAVPGGGRRLDHGQNWTIGFQDGPRVAKIWARTNCTFDFSGKGRCLTGDCDGQLVCGSFGAPPHTTAEYGLNSFGHVDYYDISAMYGFNVPVELRPTTNGCTRPVRCAVDLTPDCPAGLMAAGGCHNPCTVYRTAEYCCHDGPCRPTELSRYFKRRCRDLFTYPEDDPTSTHVCPAGTSYQVVFCP